MSAMRTLGYFVLWLVGSGVAVAVAWTGVSAVDDSLVVPAPAIGSEGAATAGADSDAAAVRTLVRSEGTDALGSITSDDESGEVTTSSDSASSDPSSPPEGDDAASEGSSTTTATTAASSTTRTPTSPIGTSTTSAVTTGGPPPTDPSSTTVASTSTSATATTATTLPPAVEPPLALTYALVGGTTRISFSPGGVTVLWATPNPGFDVEIEPESSEVRVEFRADHHRSRIDAWWDGSPQHEIRERPD